MQRVTLLQIACPRLALQLSWKSSKEVMDWDSHQHEKTLFALYVPLFHSLAHAQKDIQEEEKGSNPTKAKIIFLFPGGPPMLQGKIILPQSLPNTFFVIVPSQEIVRLVTIHYT